MGWLIWGGAVGLSGGVLTGGAELSAEAVFKGAELIVPGLEAEVELIGEK